MARMYVVEYENSNGRRRFYQVNADSKSEAISIASDNIPAIARGSKFWKITKADRKEKNSDWMYVDER